MKEVFEVYDELGIALAVRKTKRGLDNWKAKHKVERVGANYYMKGKLIFIDSVRR